MIQPNRRETLGALGTLAVGGWIGLSPQEALAQDGGGAAKEYTLPPLPYDYDALEPHIDAQTMKLHHDKHHQAYVTGLNKALAGLESARTGGEAELAKVGSLTQDLAFHGSGHTLHTILWNVMKKGGSQPSGAIASQLSRDFGSPEAMQAQFSAAAKAVKGSGWGILAWEPLAQRLVVLGAEQHQNLTVWGVAPLLVLDVWEHAYYLKYQNDRGAYVKAFWNVVNWDTVGQRLDAAKRITA
jgi:Fe-Mn family superoxide dismutase